ncbi:MAG: hypothetical protein DHS20C07_19450 [Methyloligella sp.]|nr:MAG: hypothetical protein DHS20C07_19450 [Methyloligella sp.]
MKKQRSLNKCSLAWDLLAGWGIKKATIHSAAICASIFIIFSHIPSVSSATLKSKIVQTIQYVEIRKVSLNNPKKHCVNKIEIKSEHLFMRDGWQRRVEYQTKAKWAESVKKRYGSVYSQWDSAKNKKYECRRIGFGNDKEGNVGTSVLCMIAAEPCVNLTNK